MRGNWLPATGVAVVILAVLFAEDLYRWYLMLRGQVEHRTMRVRSVDEMLRRRDEEWKPAGWHVQYPTGADVQVWRKKPQRTAEPL